jgi:hypothetical protein
VTGPLLRVSAEDHRGFMIKVLVATLTRTALGDARARATRAANLADDVPVSQVTWTSAQQITADVPERH